MRGTVPNRFHPNHVLIPTIVYVSMSISTTRLRIPANPNPKPNNHESDRPCNVNGDQLLYEKFPLVYFVNSFCSAGSPCSPYSHFTEARNRFRPGSHRT